MSEPIPACPSWLGPEEPDGDARSRRRIAWACDVLNMLRSRGVQQDDRLRILALALGHEIGRAPAGQVGATVQWCGALLCASVCGSQHAQRDQLAGMPPQGHG